MPLIWCNKDEIVLRLEVVALFKRYSLPLDCLLYKDDWLDLKKKVADKNIEVTLVDHNNGREHKDLNPFVTTIIGIFIDYFIFLHFKIAKLPTFRIVIKCNEYHLRFV